MCGSFEYVQYVEYVMCGSTVYTETRYTTCVSGQRLSGTQCMDTDMASIDDVESSMNSIVTMFHYLCSPNRDL